MNDRADWLEDLAVHNAAMPDGLSTSEQLLFLKFRLLYQTAATGSITPEQGRREKIAILDRYQQDCFSEKCWRHTLRMWKTSRLPAARTRLIGRSRTQTVSTKLSTK